MAGTDRELGLHFHALSLTSVSIQAHFAVTTAQYVKTICLAPGNSCVICASAANVWKSLSSPCATNPYPWPAGPLSPIFRKRPGQNLLRCRGCHIAVLFAKCLEHFAIVDFVNAVNLDYSSGFNPICFLRLLMYSTPFVKITRSISR